jgi:hypothetical protein
VQAVKRYLSGMLDIEINIKGYMHGKHAQSKGKTTIPHATL